MNHGSCWLRHLRTMAQKMMTTAMICGDHEIWQIQLCGEMAHQKSKAHMGMDTSACGSRLFGISQQALHGLHMQAAAFD